MLRKRGAAVYYTVFRLALEARCAKQISGTLQRLVSVEQKWKTKRGWLINTDGVFSTKLREIWGGAGVEIKASKRSTDCRTESAFHEIADITLLHVRDVVEKWIDDNSLDESDSSYENGVVAFTFGTKGTFVLNKQAPSRQLWLSSPRSGPSHYSFSEEAQSWLDTRSGLELLHFLKEELEFTNQCYCLDLSLDLSARKSTQF